MKFIAELKRIFLRSSLIRGGARALAADRSAFALFTHSGHRG